jgi:hypothetical protein
METTEWYPPDVKPVRVGAYEITFFDSGWAYEWFAWWDGRQWLSSEFGCSLQYQKQTWRGLTEKVA